MSEAKKRVAVIGGGVAGVVASYLLQRKYDVTLFEKNDYVGGHTNTVEIDSGPDAGLAVDTGFIVLNDKNYPLMHKFLEQLDVQVRWSDMSFSYHCEQSGLLYAGTNLNGLFAQRSNLLRPSFWKFLAELAKFCRKAQADLDAGGLANRTLGEYLREGRYSSRLTDDYLFPMGSAIWSSPREEIAKFPAEAFVHFFSNHGLLSLKDRPRWQTVIGGSQTYVRSFLDSFRGTVRRAREVTQLQRAQDHVRVCAEGREPETFDFAVIAVHADQALSLLQEPTEEEQRLLGAWRYELNHTVLHTDPQAMPANRRGWASWNYIREPSTADDAPASVTYYMNLLQGLDAKHEYFVTLNRSHVIRDEHIVKEFHYTHPVYSQASIATQSQLLNLQGKQRTYFCGSYFGYGFHEDAIRSAVNIGKYFDIAL